MRPEELQLIARVAYMYHELSLKQTHIAQQLDISQATVSRMLKRAEKEGIIRITVTMPAGMYAPMENDLRQRYGLKAAIIVASEDESNDESLLYHIGSAAAYYIESTLGKDEVIGLSSWSTTLLAMVNSMQQLTRGGSAHVVQILGGVGNPSAEVYATRLTERFAWLVDGVATYMPAPGVAKTPAMREAFLADEFVQQATALFDSVTLALVGIGSVEPSKLLARSGNIFSEDELRMLREAGAVGDICLRFFDADGKPVITSLDERVISMRLEQLRRVTRTVGIAGGVRKVGAIRGALNGGLINVLITDRFTAARLLE